MNKKNPSVGGYRGGKKAAYPLLLDVSRRFDSRNRVSAARFIKTFADRGGLDEVNGAPEINGPAFGIGALTRHVIERAEEEELEIFGILSKEGAFFVDGGIERPKSFVMREMKERVIEAARFNILDGVGINLHWFRISDLNEKGVDVEGPHGPRASRVGCPGWSLRAPPARVLI